MSDRNVILVKVFAYGLMAWSLVNFLASLPLQFALGPNWPHILEGAGLAAIAVVIAVIWVKYLRTVPYGWMVASVLAMSALSAWLGSMELSAAKELSSFPRPIAQPLIFIPHYIVAAASGLFVLANIVAIVITACAGDVRPDGGGSRRQD